MNQIKAIERQRKVSKHLGTNETRRQDKQKKNEKEFTRSYARWNNKIDCLPLSLKVRSSNNNMNTSNIDCFHWANALDRSCFEDVIMI